MRHTFTYAGVASSTYHAIIEAPPNYSTAEKKLDKFSVVGRNGDLVIDTGVYTNASRAYKIYVPQSDVPACVEALLGPTGYNNLADTYDSTVFRRATFIGPQDIENRLNQYGEAEIEFDCLPQCFLVSGQTAVSVTNGQNLLNNYREALPLIEITGSGNITLTVGENMVTIDGLTAGKIILDAEVQDCYYNGQNLNSIVTLSNEFPTLKHGNNVITWTGSVTAVKVMPRWWRL